MTAEIRVKAFHMKPQEHEIYLQNSRPLQVYEKRIKKLLLKGHGKITIFALSSAMRKAVILAQ